ncbi:MAG: hypothetical protein AAFP22_15660, partial [Planctomycetota bacterium]
VLMGGTSAERGVSLTSGGAMVEALRAPAGPSKDVAPPTTTVEIEPGGAWSVDGRSLSPLEALQALPQDAVFLLALHGGAGEDGRVQAFLELSGRRSTGAGPQTSALCMDKHRSRLVAADAGVAVAPAAFAPRAAIERDREAALTRFRSVPGPIRFAKHSAAGSSFGVHRCDGDAPLAAAVDAIVADGGDVLVEAEVRGLETTCGLIGDGAAAAALPVVEIEPADGTYFDYEQKYAAEGGARETCPPARLPAAVQTRIQERARTAWESFGGTGYARIDFIVPATSGGAIDDSAEPILLEANTLPGFTPRSLLPLAAEVDGVGFRELCLELVARALG